MSMNSAIIMSMIVVYGMLNQISTNKVILPINFNYSPRAISSMINLGSPPFTTNILLDLDEDYNAMVLNHEYNEASSTTITRTPNQVNDFKESILTDSASIGSLSNFPFRFVSINRMIAIQSNIKPHIGLSRAKTSFYNQLYHSGLISKRILSFTSHKLVIGERELRREDYSISCKAVAYHNKWACLFKGIFSGDKPFIIKDDYKSNSTQSQLYFPSNNDETFALFNSHELGIIAPYEALPFFRRTVFAKYLLSNRCQIIINEKEEINSKLHCEKDVKEMLGNVTIIFEKAAIVLHGDELFTITNNNKNMDTFIITFRKELRHWIFGADIIKKYNMIFNDEDNIISFLSLDNDFNGQLIDLSHIEQAKTQDILIYLLPFVLVVGLGVLIATYNKRSQSK